MRICVVGTGYVGLVAGACLSDSGNHVICLDVNKKKIDQLREGDVPIFEPGLEELITRNVKGKRLSFTEDPSKAIGPSEIIFVAVGTPSAENGSLDLRYVTKAAETIRENIKRDTIVVMKSTVPVGTADKIREITHTAKYQVEVVSNPEFLKEGTAVNDFLRPERVIIGADSESARQTMADLYAPYVRSGNPILFMSNRSAELAKYAANSFLAMKISYINEIASLCEKFDAEIHDIRKALITDSRIGNQFLYSGCGYGGSCFPKDVQALIHLGNSGGLPLEIFKAVHAVNERQKTLLYKKIQKHFDGNLKGKTISVWGLSFKPMTDDMRDAPSVSLIKALLANDCKVKAYDPEANSEAKRLFEDKIELYEDAYDCIKGTHALSILTEWNEFRSPDFKLLKQELKEPVIFDGRNLYTPESVERSGFTYYCIGKSDPK